MAEKSRTEEDKEMIDNPMSWPNWPCLPMKRHTPQGGMPDAGTILDCELGKNVIFLTSVWEVADERASFSTCERKVYASVDELLADGWMVD